MSSSSTPLSVVTRTLVRSTAIGAGILGYYAAYPLLVAPTPDADIGQGLLAFSLVVLASGLWGLVDGLRGAVPAAVLTWLLTASVVAVGWQAGLALAYGDASLPFWEYLLEPGTIAFTACLVAVPAVVAVLVGGLGRRAGNPAPTLRG